ncbi:MAG: DNA mismatch repair protein MutS [Bacteroidota bacterium]
MKQYNAIKAKYPDALLLFRVGDFYETFGDDAIKASKILGIVLTRRANGAAAYIELAGFPHHSLDSYLPKLVRSGLRVAICDQLEDPKLTKTIVKRGVTELVTPGLALNDKILDHKANNYLASIFFDSKDNIGIAFLDISTAEFYVAEGKFDYIDKLMQSLKPSEVIIPKSKRNHYQEKFSERYYFHCLEDWVYSPDFAKDILTRHFQTTTLKGFGIDTLENGILAAGAVMHYLAETQHSQIQHIQKISRIEEDKYVWLDRFTIRNLELIYSTNENAVTLTDIIDKTITPMGARMMKRWVVLPLKEKKIIDERLDVVQYFIENTDFSDNVQIHLKQISDLERLISKVAVGRINPREVNQLMISLNAVEEIKNIFAPIKNEVIIRINEQLNPCKSIKDRIAKEINPEPPMLINKGGVIADGVNEELDELRKLLYSGKDYLVQLQQKETEKTGISSLKISYNNVFGYYLEVRNTHKDKVPADWIRKQTLTGAERYITEELKEYESKILGAEEKILSLETRIFNDLILSLTEYIQPIQLNASLIANIDCLLSFAHIAIENNYSRPEVNESKKLSIFNGRHPVIEKQLPIGTEYIANDIYLDEDTQQIIIITGPNMSGKSALLRQTALIVLMAQMGSFVPADKAEIGIIDKIFTRVGASDNISTGESTFMVEMNETSSILNNLSDRSLVLLDEIGRGTSTYDGISIAWAIAEYLHDHKSGKAKVLFATHYHELNELAKNYKRIKNYNVSVKELDKKVIFLRKLMPGGSEHSFGIHVAQMAGMPKSIVKRANEILVQLEQSQEDALLKKDVNKIASKKEGYQLSFFQLEDPVLLNIKEQILKTDINTLTPIEALLKLSEIKKLVGG